MASCSRGTCRHGFGSRAPRRTSELPPNAIQLEVGATVGDAERMLIFKTLESTHNNKTRAAEILGISLKTLHNKLREYGTAALPARWKSRCGSTCSSCP